MENRKMQTFVMPTTPTLMLVDVVPLPVPMRPSKNVPMPSISIPTNNSKYQFIKQRSAATTVSKTAYLQKSNFCIMPYNGENCSK